MGIVRANPTHRLQRRFGFQTTHGDDRKLDMRHELTLLFAGHGAGTL